jgi:hypothetical protein
MEVRLLKLIGWRQTPAYLQGFSLATVVRICMRGCNSDSAPPSVFFRGRGRKDRQVVVMGGFARGLDFFGFGGRGEQLGWAERASYFIRLHLSLPLVCDIRKATAKSWLTYYLQSVSGCSAIPKYSASAPAVIFETPSWRESLDSTTMTWNANRR